MTEEFTKDVTAITVAFLALYIVYLLIKYIVIPKFQSKKLQNGNGVKERLKQLEEKQTKLETNHIQEINSRLDRIENNVINFRGDISNVRSDMSKLSERIAILETKLRNE